MEVQVRYINKNYSFTVKNDGLVKDLQQEIEKQLQIPPYQQKLILRGKPLSPPEAALSSFGVAAKAKILLVATTASPPSVSPPLPKVNTAIFLGTKENMDLEPHASNIQKGPPEGVLPSYNNQVDQLPTAPLSVLNAEGVPSKFSVESEALFIQVPSTNKAERIFFTEIHSFTTNPIKTGEYFCLSLHLKNGEDRYIYYLPKQFLRLFQKYLAGKSTPSYMFN